MPSLDYVSTKSCKLEGIHTIHSDILSSAYQDESEPPSSKVPDTSAAILTGLDHHVLYMRSKPDHAEATDCLNREDPTLSSAQLGGPHSVDNGRP